IFKLVIESKPQREQMKAAITALSKRIAAVEEHLGRDPSGSRGSCGWSKRACMGGGTAFGSADGRKEELDKKTGHDLGAEFD
ncbi:Retrovirus-related Pol polyprotein from type-2 retrotransposable element R2DM, partial [Durusdinium trenchii]